MNSPTPLRLADLALAALIFITALLPRLAIAQAYNEPLDGEERLYNRYAVPWAKGEGATPREKALPWHPFGSFTHRPPGYALFLGVIYRLAGSENFAAVRTVQAWLDASSAAGIYVLALLLFAGLAGRFIGVASRTVGLAAGLATARYDFLMQFVARLLSESFFLWLSLAFLIVALVAVRRQRPAWSLLGGYVLGLANLTRPFLLPAAPGYLLWLAIAPQLDRRRRHVALAALGLVLAIGPVTLRNWQFHHQFILISTNSGFTLFKSLSEVEGLRDPAALGTQEEVEALGLGEVAEQAEYRRRALDYMRTHPRDLPAIFARKAEVLLAAKGGFKISHVLMVTPDDEWLYPLALLGACLSLLIRPGKAWHPRLLVVGVIASQYLVSLLANAEVRYRVPIVPLLLVLAAWAAWGLVDAGASFVSARRQAGATV